jgi:hypothetical protein
MAVHEGMKNMH